MDLHPVDILINVINIIVLFVLLRIILWKPINRFLSGREQRIIAKHEEAEKTLLDAEALKQEYAANLEGIEAKGRDMMRESEIKATEESEEILLEAREKARNMLDEARERIADEKKRAVDNARREIAELATDMAERILKREVVPGDNMSAVEDFFRD